MDWYVFGGIVFIVAVVIYPVAKQEGRKQGWKDALSRIDDIWEYRPDVGGVASFIGLTLRSASSTPLSTQQEEALRWLMKLEEAAANARMDKAAKIREPGY